MFIMPYLIEKVESDVERDFFNGVSVFESLVFDITTKHIQETNEIF